MADLDAALQVAAPRVKAAVWGPALTAAFARYELNTPQRMAAAIGQFMEEAGPAFAGVTESLVYTHADHIQKVFGTALFPTVASAQPYVDQPQKLANYVYAGKNGNGSEASGDGYRFIGRGLIQLTGRGTYARFGQSIGKSADDAVSECETTAGAAMSGCWYLASNGCLPLADAWNIEAITGRVNRKKLGAAQRLANSNAMLAALNA